MSVSPFPDPITTNFIPEAWQYIDLWSKFINYLVTYPKAQYFTINFQDPVKLTTRTALTQMASTAYATSEIVAWVTANVTPILGSAFTSAVLQYYFGGIRVNTINPLTTGGTLTIGNGSATNNVSIMSASNTGILTLGSSGSTTTLNCPITPMYTVPVIPVGAIGYRAPITFVANGSFSDTPITVRSCSVTQGTWLIYFFVNLSGIFVFNSTIQFGTAFGRRGTFSISNSTLGGNPILVTIGGMTYFSSTQTVNFQVRNGSGGSLVSALNPTTNCVAYRIA